MAPKRKRRVSLTSKGLAPGEQLRRNALPRSSSPWFWVSSEANTPADITSEHLLATCGLSQRNGHPFCANKYVPASETSKNRKDCKTETTSSNVEGELDEDIIVISDDEGLLCTKKLCKNNPNCLNYMGQEKWEDADSIEKQILKAAKLGDSPILDSREPDLPVGLRNLGATCYANASLQVWFRDLAFRSGVYKCQPSQGTDDKFMESPIFQLQVTFAALQESTQSVFNPTKLVESLQLRTAEQQDAQEFSKLFMSHLDAEFKKQSLPSVQSLVTDQFQGTQVYGTLCNTCEYRSERTSDFLEIEINFENNSKLEDRISALLQPEILSGDNKYFCSKCNCLQDATRYTELRKLPPVLHFSLLRFVYDLDTMERKKSKHTISFPSVLDMNRFLGSDPDRPHITEKKMLDDDIYELRGVLLHKGSSAYHGHYEAQVYDAANRSWFQFNDEIVTKIKTLGDKFVTKKQDDCENGQKSKTSQVRRNRATARKRQRIDDSDDDAIVVISPPNAPTTERILITSKEAYMLIYAKKASASLVDANVQNNDAGQSSNVLTPPSKALDIIRVQNAAHDKACEEEAAIKARSQDVRRQIMEIYHSWNASSASTESVVVGKDALEAWLCKYSIEVALDPPKHKKRDNSISPTQEFDSARQPQPPLMHIPNEDILCSHRRLDPNKAQEIKRITQQAYDRIISSTSCVFDPAPKPSEVCRDCVIVTFRERLYEIEHPRVVQKFDEICDVAEGSDGYWISKKWLRDWRLQRPKTHVTSQDDPAPDAADFAHHVQCEHGGLSLNATNRRRISEKAADLLKTLYTSWDPISTDSDLCAVCKSMIHFSKEDKKEIRRKAEEEKAKLKHLHGSLTFGTHSVESGACAILPTLFLKRWRQWLNSPTEHPRPGAIDNTPFICQHDKLAFDPNYPLDLEYTLMVIKLVDWEVLESLYPGGPLIAVEQCTEPDGSNKFVHDISVCTDCRLKRKLDWDTAEITIRLFGSKAASNEFGLSHRKAPITYSHKLSGPRQSKRLREIKESGERRRLTVSKSTTVKEIKIMIQEELNIPTICQQLEFHHQMLDDNAKTVESLGILANDVIDLREEKEVLSLDSDSDSMEPVRKKRRDEGRGFGGTLLGSTAEYTSGSGDDTPCQLPQPGEKNCSACTFSNPYDALTCTICDTLFI